MSLQPDKQLGQHWLRNEDVLEDICGEAGLSLEDVVLEIGPGLGTLTKYIAKHSKEVIAVEFDPRLAENLKQNPIASNVEIIQNDILKFNLSDLPKGYKVVANLPYYITSKITRLLLESDNPPSTITILVQKEVAERMAANPGDMSILAASVQYYCHTKLGPIVPAELFTPPPEVDSQVITLIKREKPLFEDIDKDKFFKTVRAGFSEKRKKLRNSLSGGLHLDKKAIEELLEKSQIDQSARAEELDLESWYRLTRNLLLP